MRKHRKIAGAMWRGSIPGLNGLSVRGRPGSAGTAASRAHRHWPGQRGVAAAHAVHAASGSVRAAEIQLLDGCLGAAQSRRRKINCG